MNTNEATTATRFKVGIFTILGLLLIGAITIYVNDKPYWWRSCQLVHINVEDATGLKSKSPVKSLGIEIGYLESVDLFETHVALGICITAPVEVLPATRAYIRSDGFLGDKFVELKPVRYVGGGVEKRTLSSSLGRLLWSEAYAATPSGASEAQEPQGSAGAPAQSARGEREIPVGAENQDVQHLVTRVDELVNQVTGLANNLKQAINPEDLKRTMRELNRTLEAASRTLSPEGGLNQTAQRTLAKLEDAIEQLRDMMTRVNKGEGSVGMLLNDPSYAEEIREAIRNVNRLLGKVSGIRFNVDIGGEEIPTYNGGRGWFELSVWPRDDKYYVLGLAVDPRGKISTTSTTTYVAGLPPTTVQTTQTDTTGILLTGMVGRVFWRRLDLSLGVLYSDGAGQATFDLGPHGREDRFQVRNDIFFRNTGGTGGGVDYRLDVILRPYSIVYFRAGIDSVRAVSNGLPLPWFYGAGVSFDDEDIRLLFALR